MRIVSLIKDIVRYREISERYGVGYEINDFFEPAVLDDENEIRRIIDEYKNAGIPNGSTMHGAFFDVLVHSRDKRIADIGKLRMRQCMEIAEELGVEAVVFHVNYQPGIPGDAYVKGVIDRTSEYLAELLVAYKDINVYIENMFEDDVMVIKEIADRLSCYHNFGVCLDYAHAIVYGKGADNWTETLSQYIRHVHINDNDLITDLHLPVGSGRIDWDKFYSDREQYFPKASILIEVTNPEGQIASIEYLRGMTERRITYV